MNEGPTSTLPEDLDNLSRDELVTLARAQRERIAELEHRSRLIDLERESEGVSLIQTPELPSHLKDAIRVGMEDFHHDFNHAVAKVNDGYILVLMAGEEPQARLESSHANNNGTPIKRRDLYRKRTEWIRRLEQGETLAPIGTDMLLCPLTLEETTILEVRWPELASWDGTKKPQTSKPQTPARRHADRLSKLRLSDVKRTEEERQRLETLRAERRRAR